MKNLPNILTAFRIVIIPFFIAAFVFSKPATCLILFLLSGITDIADGFAARWLCAESNLGRILDPIADKLTYATVVFCMFSKGRLPLTFVIIFVLLQLLHLVFMIIILKTKGTVVKSNKFGKAAGFSMFAMSVILLAFYEVLGKQACRAVSISVLCVMILASAIYFVEYFFLRKEKDVCRPTEEQ